MSACVRWPRPNSQQRRPRAENHPRRGRQQTAGEAKKKGDKGKQRHPSKAQQLAKGIQQLAEEYLPRLKKYEAQEAILDGRNSYAKTDHDATFMRMKEDAAAAQHGTRRADPQSD